MPSEGPRRLHVLSPVFYAGGHLRRLWPLALIVVAQGRFWLLLPGAAVLLAVAGLEWLRRTYALEAGALRMEEGVFGRKLRVVPFDRIQQVDLIRKPLHRLLGVATLRVETAGGGSAAEVDLDAVSLTEAQALRSSLLRAKAGAVAVGAAGGEAVPAEAVAAAPPERVVLRLSLGEVMLAGITGSRAAAVLAVLGPLSQVTDWFPDLSDWLLRRFNPEAVAPTTPAAFLAVAVLAAVVWLGLAAASSVVTDFGFTLARVGGDAEPPPSMPGAHAAGLPPLVGADTRRRYSEAALVVRRGLLERREAVLPLARLQVVRIEESLLRRAFGLASIRLQSAGRVARDDQTASRLAIPVLPRSDVNRLLGELLPGAAPVPGLLVPPPAARRRAVVRALLGWVLPVAAVALALLPVTRLALLAVLVVVPLAVAGGLAAYRSLGHAGRDGFLYARRGALIRVTTVVPTVKAQSGRVRSSPFQRRAGLATLHVDIAGGGPTPRVLDEAEATAERLLQAVLGRSA
jgi:putative membrane protein